MTFVAELWYPEIYNFNTMCKIYGRAGTVIPALFGGDTCIGLEDIARKREGARNNPSPSGARVKYRVSRKKTATIVFGHKCWNIHSKVKIYTLLCCQIDGKTCDAGH